MGESNAVRSADLTFATAGELAAAIAPGQVSAAELEEVAAAALFLASDESSIVTVEEPRATAG